jgi:hypothetical protein
LILLVVSRGRPETLLLFLVSEERRVHPNEPGCSIHGLAEEALADGVKESGHGAHDEYAEDSERDEDTKSIRPYMGDRQIPMISTMRSTSVDDDAPVQAHWMVPNGDQMYTKCYRR